MTIDSLILTAYILFIFFLAYRASKAVKTDSSDRKTQVQEQFMAGKSLTFTESICSILATEVSALTFLGIPAYAFNSDFSFVQIYMGAILGRFVIAKFFLPRIYDKGLTIYEIMNDSHKDGGRRTVAIFYAIAKILSVGVRLFSGSILVAQFLGTDMHSALALVTFITFLYTLIGGLKAVVRTDILQLGLFVCGGIFAHIFIPITVNESWTDLMSFAFANGKTSFFDFSNPSGFILGFVGGILFDMATHGVDQDFAQRLLANSSLKKAQLAIFISSFFSITIGFIFLGIGALLWSHYQGNLPVGVLNADHLFSYFIVNHFPVGLKGLIVSGVMAATMSTLDSTINALCATVYNDILPKRETSKFKFFAFIDTTVITLLLFVVAVVASQNDGLLLLGLKIQSWTAGPLVGLFMSKILFKKFFPYKLDIPSVVGAYLFGILGVYLNSHVLAWNWNLNVYLGCFLAMIFLKIYSSLRPNQ
jgi:Na+/proline symporter